MNKGSGGSSSIRRFSYAMWVPSIKTPKADRQLKSAGEGLHEAKPTFHLWPRKGQLEQPLLKRAHGADIFEQPVAPLLDLPHQRCTPSPVGDN